MLIQRMDDKDPKTRENTIKALVNMGPSVIEPLIMAFESKRPNIRDGAVKALVDIGTPAVDPLIVALAKGKYPRVRMCAAEALGKIKDIRAVEPLISALENDDDVRIWAATALGEIGDIRAVRPLFSALKNAVKTKHISEQVYITWAMEKLGPHGIEPLIASLKNKELEIIAAAYTFFIRRGEPGTETLLIDALNKHGNFTMANAFIRSGNNQLKEAGQKWIKVHPQHGLVIDILDEKYNPKWGSAVVP
jgi:HEAT repeat protein